MIRRRLGNSLHKAQARNGGVKPPTIINTSKKATVFDWERVSAEERRHKQNQSKAVAEARNVKPAQKRKKRISPILSEIEFSKTHNIHPKNFNKMIKGLKKLYKLRERHRLTKGKVISNPETIAIFLRELTGNEKINLTEQTIVAFSNWALGRDPTKLTLLK